MRRVKLIAVLFAILVLLVLALQNPDAIDFRFLWMKFQIPEIVLLVAAGVVGAVVTLLTQVLLHSGYQAPEKRENSSAGSGV